LGGIILKNFQTVHELLDSLIHLDRRPNLVLRFADRYLGIPIVALLRFARRKRTKASDNVRSIGLMGNSAIGDTVILSAAILDIRAKFPDARLVVFAPGVDCASICGMIRGIDAVVPVRMSQPLATIKTIRRLGPFDIWFDCGPWARTNAIVSYFAPSAVRIGFATERQYRHGLFDLMAEHGNDVHEVVNFRRLLAAAGIPGNHIPTITLPHTPATIRRIVMHVMSGGTAAAMKLWPESYWVALIDHANSLGIPVVLTGSGRDQKRLENLRNLCQIPSLIANAAGLLTLDETRDLLASSLAVVSVDTGIMHLAAALNCRLLALFGATSPRRWGPLNARAKALSSARDCSPCVSLGIEKGCGTNICMAKIMPETVMSELDALISQT
jgi:heptosyltransferase I